MNWLTIILGIIQLILGRIMPAPNRSQAYNSMEPNLCLELAYNIAAMNKAKTNRAMSTREIEVLAAGLPGFIDSIIGLLPKDFWTKAGGCAVTSLLKWIQTQNLQTAISDFVACTLSGIGGGGGTNPPGGGGTTPPPGGGGNPPGGGGGIDPNAPTFRTVDGVCG
jgi:hypothetical protein